MQGSDTMKKYALAGASSRCLGMFARPIAEKYKHYAKIAGIFDINRTRAEYIAQKTDPDAPVYTDFEKMIRETSPDVVIITTVDSYHDEYIIRAMESGCDVITEKPIATDELKCNAILEAERRTGRKITVTFNYRFMPYFTRIKELIREGIIGDIYSVNFEDFLDRSHGADYFRRWHRRKEYSGGLLVHKSTHHLDIINWFLEDDPETVYANGALMFYGPTRERRGERCSTCRYKNECEFAVEYDKDQFMKNFYFNAEHEDGYRRDACVFSEDIDIEDTMSVNVRYSRGTLLTYSLVAYSTYEGWNMTLIGTKGRLEAWEDDRETIETEPMQYIRIINSKGENITYSFRRGRGAHSGGDELLQRMIFAGGVPDPLGKFADATAGVKSAMIGICANKSMKEGRPIKIESSILKIC